MNRQGPLVSPNNPGQDPLRVLGHEIAQLLREDAAHIQSVVDGKTPDLGLNAVGQTLIRHLLLAADNLDL